AHRQPSQQSTASPANPGQIDAQSFCQRARGRYGSDMGRLPYGVLAVSEAVATVVSEVGAAFLITRWHAAPPRAAIPIQLEFNQQCARSDPVARFAVRRLDDTGNRRRNLDDGFRGLDCEHGVIGTHAVAAIDMPTDDFGLGQSLTQI